MPLEDLTKRADTTDYDDSVVKDMPVFPGLALTSHVMLKTIQVCDGNMNDEDTADKSLRLESLCMSSRSGMYR